MLDRDTDLGWPEIDEAHRIEVSRTCISEGNSDLLMRKMTIVKRTAAVYSDMTSLDLGACVTPMLISNWQPHKLDANRFQYGISTACAPCVFDSKTYTEHSKMPLFLKSVYH